MQAVAHQGREKGSVEGRLMGIKPLVLAGPSPAFHLLVIQKTGKDSPGEAQELSSTVRTADEEAILDNEREARMKAETKAGEHLGGPLL